MQRLLVGLILVLTAAVAGLWISYSDLRDDLDARINRRSSGTAREAPGKDGASLAQVKKLETRVANMMAQMDQMRAETDRMKRRKPVRVERASASGNGDATATPDPNLDTRINRDGEGGFVISEEDEEYFMAIQKRVERRRRLDGMTRNLMRRVDRLVRNNEIPTIQDADRPKVENAIRTYVEANDDIVTRFVREPPEDIKSLTPEQRREQLNSERDKIAVETQQALAGVVGADAAALITERTVTRSSSVRRGGFNRNRRNR
ncbi:MAG: hypothetical protein OER88_09070 [Planctomycetota bacterium]|nr:hypothetical protein [Planctomycetota bacterium]